MNMANQDNTTLLIVGFDVISSQELYDILKNTANKIEICKSGKQALKKIQREKINGILLYQNMPDIILIDFLTEVKKKTNFTKVLIASSPKREEDALQAVNDGYAWSMVSFPWSDILLKNQCIKMIRIGNLQSDRNYLLREINIRDETITDLREILDKDERESAEKLELIQEQLRFLKKKREEEFSDIIRVLSAIISRKNKKLGNHCRRVAALSIATSQWMGNSEAITRDIEIAAMLHDFGKIYLSNKLMFEKVDTVVNANDINLIKEHPLIADAVLHILKGFSKISEYILHHHENYNGTGFPNGLSGSEIPLPSKIISITDYYDHLTNIDSNSIKTNEEVFFEIKKQKSKKFDPDILKIFSSFLREGSRLRDNEIMVSIKQLKIGMVLTRDVVTSRGIIIVHKGEMIRKSYYDKIFNYQLTDPVRGSLYVVKSKIKSEPLIGD